MFNKRFKSLQEAKGWTLMETARKIGVHVDTIHTYRTVATPKFKHLTNIAKAFGVSLEYLITGKDSNPKNLNDFSSFKKFYASLSPAERSKIKKWVEKK